MFKMNMDDDVVVFVDVVIVVGEFSLKIKINSNFI